MRKGLLLFLSILSLLIKPTYAIDIKSNGDVVLNKDQNNIVVNTMDLFKIKDSLTILEEKYNGAIITALSTIGTIVDENYTFDTLIEGIVNSQYVDSNVEALADNISLGKKCWVNGVLITGTGADNDAFYNKGFVEGKASVSTDAEIHYTYHTCTSGCYSQCGGYYTSYHPRYQGQCDPGFWLDCWDCTSCGSYVTWEKQNQRCTASIKVCGKISGVTIEKAEIIFN